MLLTSAVREIWKNKVEKGTKDDAVVSALDAFHEAAFSPKVALGQLDLSSLDGSPVRVSADQVVKGILQP